MVRFLLFIAAASEAIYWFIKVVEVLTNDKNEEDVQEGEENEQQKSGGS